jgi:hypothetical protein
MPDAPELPEAEQQITIGTRPSGGKTSLPIVITLPQQPPSAGVYIPADLEQPAPLTKPKVARRNVVRATIIAVVIMFVGAFFSVGPANHIAGSFLTFSAGGKTYIITPGPIGHSHPIAFGSHDFICAALPFARDAQEQMIDPPHALEHPWYLSVILAQWGIEQGWAMPTYTGYNFGNVSAIAGQPLVPGTNQPGSPGAFAFAGTAEQGVADYVLFAKNGLYGAVADAWPLGPRAQALALGASPWDANHYTGINSPGSSLLAVIQINNLTRFDNPNATC